MTQVLLCLFFFVLSRSSLDQGLSPGQGSGCPSCFYDSTDFLQTLHRIEERPFSLPTPDEQGRYPRTFYQQLREVADRHRHDTSSCLNELNKLYAEHSVWKDFHYTQKATMVLAIIRREIARLRQSNQAQATLNEDTMACIVRKENPFLIPEKVNFTFCEPERNKHGRPLSAAFGLGQITSGTLYGYHQKGFFDEFLPQYVNKRNIKRQIFYAINNKPVLQIRMSTIIMNELLKENSLEEAIDKYDNYGKSQYMKDFRSCRACFQKQKENGDEVLIKRCLPDPE